MLATISSSRALLAALLLLSAPFAAIAQAPQPPQVNSSGITIETNPQLFATMCALEAAGFAADESTLAEMPSRLSLREDLLKLHGPASEALRQFYRDHALADPGETLSRYIAFALVAEPPPQFRLQVKHELLPPDVIALDGFQLILVNFYVEAQLETRWIKIEPEYDRAAARYQSRVRRIVTLTNAYLRELLKPQANRAFTVYVEPFVGNRSNFRNNGDHYAIVVGTGSQFPEEDIQHAYLHFLLDPLPLRYRKEVLGKSALLDTAARAPRLPVEYQTDFLGFTDECLIKAVELRLRHLPPAQLDSALTDADRSGFILVRPLAAQLQKFEKAEPAMSYYFPELIAGIDLAAEQKRVKNIQFAPAKTAGEPKGENSSSKLQKSDLESWLSDGNHEIAVQDAAAATATFEKILAKYPDEPRAVYGLAIASILSGNADRARELFGRLVSALSPPLKAENAANPSILAWSHIYLGRLDDLEGERDLALVEYHAALAVEGAPDAARVAAQRGLEQVYNPRAHENGDRANGNADGPQKP